MCENKHRVIILQDRNEAKNAKNTARLLKLNLTNIEIIQSDQLPALQQLAECCSQDPSQYALFFPSADSVSFEQALANEKSMALDNIDTAIQTENLINLIFLDGTWRKTKRLYLSHDWLRKLPCVHFEKRLKGQYRIRKTSIENGVSTLEAVSYVLQKLENVDTKPLLNILQKMQSFWP